ncbi:CAP domain-containing protein [Cryobacterium sp. AP23]
MILSLSLGAGALPAFAATSDTATIASQTNAARVAQGLPVLKRNAAMDAVAQAWAVKMATSGYKHNPDYATQIPAGWTLAAENIAMGYTSGTVVKAWLNSPGHYANIMGAHTDIGIGYVVGADGAAYSVQNFAEYSALTGTPTPTVSGAARVGQTLTAIIGAWAPALVTVSYQWRRGGVAIAGATAKTYKATAADLAKSLTVSVTGKKTGFSSVTKTSAATALVVANLTATPVPTITGTARVGQTLTAVSGTWAPAPVTLSYQWKRGGTAITGATGWTFVVRSADLKGTLTVTVTGKKASYGSVVKTSAATDVVAG